MKSKVKEILDGLQHFHGSETFYKIPLIGTRYTEGLKYLAQAADCYWLITDASVIAKSLMDRSYFISLDFKRLSEEEQDASGHEAKIEYGDGNGNILETHPYTVTDFPLQELRLFFVDGTLMLPGEY